MYKAMTKQIRIYLFLFLATLLAGLPAYGRVGSGIITMTTAKKVGEKFALFVEGYGDITIEGAEKSYPSNYYEIEDQRIVIRGDVTELRCTWDSTMDSSVRYNRLTALNASGCPTLKTLDCSVNELTNLNVSGCTALRELRCSNNRLTELDVSGCTALTKLSCYNNRIKGEAMTRLVNSLPDRTGKEESGYIFIRTLCESGCNFCLESDVTIARAKNWQTKDSDGKNYNGMGSEVITFTTAKRVGETIYIYPSQDCDFFIEGVEKSYDYDIDEESYTLTAQQVTIYGRLNALDCSWNQLTALDVSKNTALTELDCSQNQLTALNVSKNAALTELDCSQNQLTALDVSHNTVLTKLACSQNQLTALDISHNTALTELNCESNQLTSLNVSGCTALTELDCYSNQLTALDVSGCTALKGLECYNNKLTKLDVSKNVALIKLDCYSNQLTSLDVSGCTELTELNCSDNQIKGEEMTRLVKSLRNLSKWDFYKFVVVREPAPEGNLCSTYDVGIARSKNWKVYKYNSDTEELVPYEGEDTYPAKVTLTKVGEGTLTATGADDLNAVPYGTELTIEATPAAGYELTALTAKGADILATKKVVVKGATEIKAIFTKKTAADRVEAGSVRLYPNPASTYVNVKAAKADALVRLYDANGTLLYEARTDDHGMLQIELSTYAEGTYLLLVDGNAQRLLIQR